MGPVATAILSACLQALKWLLWLTAALFVVLLVVQYFRGDLPASGQGLIMTGVAFAIAGWISGLVARWLTSRDR